MDIIHKKVNNTCCDGKKFETCRFRTTCPGKMLNKNIIAELQNSVDFSPTSIFFSHIFGIQKINGGGQEAF